MYTTVTTAEQVTEEIIELVRGIESGWYNDKPIDWEDVWDRIEGSTLNDGTRLDLGTESDSAAMRKIQRIIREERRAG